MIQDAQKRNTGLLIRGQPSPPQTSSKSFILQTEKLRPRRKGVLFGVRVIVELLETAGEWESGKGERKGTTWERSHLLKLRDPQTFA